MLKQFFCTYIYFMDTRNNPFVSEQDAEYENLPDNSEDSPASGMLSDSQMTSTSSPRRRPGESMVKSLSKAPRTQAMTTAVVAALLQYLGMVNISSSNKDQHHKMKHNSDLNVVYMIAQAAHCIAQEKVGSGFNVNSAVYGSQRYIRFSPKVLSSTQSQGAAKGNPLHEVIADVLQDKWDHERTDFSLPPLMTLLLGEPENGGSSTPSMIREQREVTVITWNHTLRNCLPEMRIPFSNISNIGGHLSFGNRVALFCPLLSKVIHVQLE